MTDGRIGFGLKQVTTKMIAQTRDALEQIVRQMDGLPLSQDLPELDAAALMAAEALLDVAEQATHDWFMLSALMSHPSPRLAWRLSVELEKLEASYVKGDIRAVDASVSHLEKIHLQKIAAHFQEASRDMSASPSQLTKWAYVIEAAEDPSFVVIGATQGTTEDVLAQLENANPDIGPFGISAAWRVTDQARAAALLKSAFEYRQLENGFYSCRTKADFKAVKLQAESELESEKIVVGNPIWRCAITAGLEADKLLGIAMESPAFTTDVSEVFAAFRR